MNSIVPNLEWYERNANFFFSFYLLYKVVSLSPIWVSSSLTLFISLTGTCFLSHCRQPYKLPISLLFFCCCPDLSRRSLNAVQILLPFSPFRLSLSLSLSLKWTCNLSAPPLSSRLAPRRSECLIGGWLFVFPLVVVSFRWWWCCVFFSFVPLVVVGLFNFLRWWWFFVCNCGWFFRWFLL